VTIRSGTWQPSPVTEIARPFVLPITIPLRPQT
jgi:hypothetical protein